MKASLLLFAFELSVALSIPITYPEWEMISDGNDRFHLVNIKEAQYEARVSPRADFGVYFLLSTRSNPSKDSVQEIITGNAASLSNSYYSASRPTRIIIHGWKDSATKGPGPSVGEAYLQRGDFNVIVVDWSAGASVSNQMIAAENAITAGIKVAEFLNFLNAHGTSFDNIYLIGHSLGSHVSGNAGKHAKSKPNTIFALDPPAPTFEVSDPDSILSSSDATYVETIHTSSYRMGYDEPLGTASFFPAWGKAQPGCGTDASASCSHARVIKYFAESLAANNEFLGKKCSSYSQIKNESCPGVGTGRMGGEPSNHGVTGIFYVPINPDYPFATGKV